mmetsp:Transcript_20576/g.51183  ORF Transcript_20576/g.51183 Transcript_20576/m.51183 type:complete len:84 (+) Transcript_20576:1059-1310(+)
MSLWSRLQSTSISSGAILCRSTLGKPVLVAALRVEYADDESRPWAYFRDIRLDKKDKTIKGWEFLTPHKSFIPDDDQFSCHSY